MTRTRSVKLTDRFRLSAGRSPSQKDSMIPPQISRLFDDRTPQFKHGLRDRTEAIDTLYIALPEKFSALSLNFQKPRKASQKESV
ncbi:MAG: hypothetical protein D6728_05995 [Cyanobacteria bacterium J055]|nr:MAG: hypothetical protein D6728_05995 [Cyanobacteria bacterium J055]